MKTLTFFNQYPKIITILYNIYMHMQEDDKDFPIVICGDEGVGKSMLALHLYELWYRVILKKRINKNDIKNINVSRLEWLNNFDTLKTYEMNINDEGADGLSSKEAIKKFGRDLEKLYKIFRKKKFISPILIPDYFDLSPYFRKRVRGLFWVNGQGKFKYYTKEGIKWLNELNLNRHPKNMFLARPYYQGVYPKYEGVLLLPYLQKSDVAVKEILNEIISNHKETGLSVVEEKIKFFLEQNITHTEIGKKLNISQQHVSRIVKRIKEKTGSI